MLRAILLVGIGGGIGSIFRYLTSVFISKYFSASFPWATFTVNLTGCLLIGLLMGYFGRQQAMDTKFYWLFVTGFCGGYTTFSTFSSENIHLLQSGNTLTALLYIAGSILCGLLAVWLGLVCMKLYH
jgi:CrcB protein